MEDPEEDKQLESLEDPGTSAAQLVSPDAGISNSINQETGGIAPPPVRKEKFIQRIQNLVSRINIYLLLFVLVILLAVGVVFVSMQRAKRETNQANLATEQLTTEQLQKISGTEAKVGDPKQTLTIESNALFSGKVLIRGSLDVAGEIKSGAALNVSGLTVTGNSTFGQVAANGLAVADNASIQGQLNVRGNVAVSGSASFGGPFSAPQATVQSLLINGDLQLNRHIDAGGSTPGKSNGTALGGGGTSSLSGTDTAGTLAINTGSGPAAGCFATINFAKPFNTTPHVVITPVGSGGSALDYYVNRTSTNFSICTSTAPPASASFAFDYIVID